MNKFDVVIVGGGPIGIACAIEALKRKLSYVILEKGTIVNSLYNYPEGMTFFSSSDKLEIDEIPFISNNAKPYKAEALEYYRRIVTSKDLNINLFEAVNSIKKTDGIFNIDTSKTTYQARNVVLATGFYDAPNLLNVIGEQLPKVSHYYKNPHYYARQKVAIVGASNSSVDAALEIYRKGGEVTMIVRGKAIGDRVKYWVKPDIENRIAEGSIKAFFDSEIKEIKEGEIIVEQKDQDIHLENDYVLALTGYMPNFTFIHELGVELSSDDKKHPTYNPLTMESNIVGIYLAGVLCGGMETHKWFIENSIIHAPLIMSDIALKLKQNKNGIKK
jgi:putative YpdA family bacillithiol system oxidoreductase